MPDLVFVSMEDWDDVWRRNQFVCAELSRRHPDTRILFVGLPRNISNALRTGRWKEIIASASGPVPGLTNIMVTRPIKLLPDSIGIGRWINQWLFRGHVRRAMRRLGIRRPMLWLNPHSAVHMVGRMGEVGAVYDITDDWTSLAQSKAVQRLTIADDATLCAKADAVIVCSKRLYKMKDGMARRLYLIENGVNAEHYVDVLGQGPVPLAAQAWAKPVFGYTGTVHPERVDVGLMEWVARRLEKGSMVFVGPNHLPTADQARLVATGKIHFTGPVAYVDLPNYMRAIDACIVPHRLTSFTESLNPIKLWEYLAAGKPIVSTPVAGFRDYPQFVSLATTADQFALAMSAALKEGTELSAARRAEAAKHSWASRVDQIESVLNEVLKCK